MLSASMSNLTCWRIDKTEFKNKKKSEMVCTMPWGTPEVEGNVR